MIACVWFAFSAAWGMFQIPGNGHSDSGSAATACFSAAIVRFKMLYPAGYAFQGTCPPPSAYYCHHPFGCFYATALLLWIFGEHDFVVHLPAILMSIGIPPLLYGIGRQLGGPVVGAVATFAYVVVPIAVGFTTLNALETPGIFGSLLFFWGHSVHQATRRTRFEVASLVGLSIACSADWSGYCLVAPLLGWSFLRAFVFPTRWTPHFDFKTYARWWALSAVIAVCTFLLWVGLFQRADKIGDWLAAGDLRGGGGIASLKAALEARKNWIDFSFTPLAIGLGKMAVPVVFVRLLLFRRDEEAYSLSVLLGATAQYVAFKGGADVHVFWPHQFAEYFALGMAQLSATVGSMTQRGCRFLTSPSRARTIGACAALVLGILPSLAMAPNAAQALLVWRRTGGRYDDNGARIRSDIDLLFVIKHLLVPSKRPDWVLDVSPSISWYWEHTWTWHGEQRPVTDPAASQPSTTTHPYWIGRASGLVSGEQTRIAGEAHVQAYGDIWVVDQRRPPAPIDAFHYEEREPNPFEWLVFGGWEPVREIGGIDPLQTWEWRVHLGQPSPAPTSGNESSLQNLRILHNVAVYTGATARVRELRAKIDAQLDRSVAADFDRGLQLIGVRVTHGVHPQIEILFLAGGAINPDSIFRVRSTIEARAPFSLIPVDPVDRDMAFPPRIPTKLWRAGFLYEIDVVLNHRIGVERYWGVWSNSQQRLDHHPVTNLATLR